MVEDDASVRALLRQMLAGLGYTVLAAGSPEEAIRLAEEHAGDIAVLVTDAVLPEMNGRELEQRLRLTRPRLASLFMSGYTANVIAHRGVLDDGVQFIQKPFSREDLVTKVRQALRGRQAGRLTVRPELARRAPGLELPAASRYDGPMADSPTIAHLGSRLELFVDHALIESMQGVRLALHHPCEAPTPREPLCGAYATVIRDGGLYRAWYRSCDPEYRGERFDGNPGELTSYSESADGHEWTHPELGLHEVTGSTRNNVILARHPPFSHNFSPFLDRRPGVPEEERYKALAGTYPGGLHGFRSADGIRWSMMQQTPVMAGAGFEPLAFDSQNVSFWSEAEGRYVCYFRSWRTSHGELRTVSRATSEDYRHWSPPASLDPNLPEEHLYTSGTHPYFRAPHLYVALPTRFVPSRGNSTEILFMTARGDARFDRTFREAFIRPGPDPARWGNRANYAALNVLPTGPMEMSVWHCHGGKRYVLRTDGFASVSAGYEPGELLTRALTFEGRELLLNASTSATGAVRVEVQRPDGRPVQGLSLEESVPVVGDAVELAVAWKGGGTLGALAGKPIRLRFLLRDCDVYALRFR